ncbi:hypothetical protein L226DRAFT_33996 [Lentinus tigrinus ALCF2SS1-7]|uniref:uncharacterized protein n=1 Tax=Lentinus tigrinus ALCF2SS1-7 TaxID=1328758 RepID=UPI001165CA00|nr:hypothetical protein L226DRAFT_33996 [Lentinus tigrinus ALCF2SS1-7]
MSSSAAQKLTKKQKKALAFRERKGKGKGKPTSFDELDNDVPVAEDQDLAEAELDAEAAAVEAPKGRAKAGAQGADGVGEGAAEGAGKAKGSGKKRKRGEEDEGGDRDGTQRKEGGAHKQAKKKRKGVDGAVEVDGEEEAEEGGSKKEKGQQKQRYILFVGNLKYTTTKEAVEQHFAKCDPPPTVRLMTPKPSATSKSTTKSKGFAFVEFSHKNALQQGLKLHQSELDGRKINVELTAGGGGKSEARLEKVKKRNKELHDQRKKQVMKRTSGKKKTGEEGAQDDDVQMDRPQRYSATSGVELVPLKKRTWSIPEADDVDEEGRPAKKRGSKKGKSRPPKPLGTGVNAIPVG